MQKKSEQELLNQISVLKFEISELEKSKKQSLSAVKRQQSNGLYTKAVRGTLTEEEAKLFTFKVWDCVPAEEYASVGTISYDSRRQYITNCEFKENIGQVYGEKYSTLEQCMEFYTRMRDAGQEGAVIKVASAVWEDARSKNYVKLKNVSDIDARCIDYEVGQGKYKGMIGALICVTDDGKIRFSVGTGLKDSDRIKDPSEYLEHIIECSYNEIISAKGRDTKSLFLPVFKTVRYDKNTTNTMEELT